MDTFPPPLLTATARAVAVSALTGLGAVHASWVLGSTWPAASRQELADAVVGAQVPPTRAPTAVMAAGLLASAALVAAAPSRGRAGRGATAALGAAFVARAAVGGSGAARVITGASPSARFQSLDRRLYRPLCAVVGAALLLVAADAPRSAAPSLLS